MRSVLHMMLLVVQLRAVQASAHRTTTRFPGTVPEASLWKVNFSIVGPTKLRKGLLAACSKQMQAPSEISRIVKTIRAREFINPVV